jgi:hypothetical protein
MVWLLTQEFHNDTVQVNQFVTYSKLSLYHLVSGDLLLIKLLEVFHDLVYEVSVPNFISFAIDLRSTQQFHLLLLIVVQQRRWDVSVFSASVAFSAFAKSSQVIVIDQPHRKPLLRYALVILEHREITVRHLTCLLQLPHDFINLGLVEVLRGQFLIVDNPHTNVHRFDIGVLQTIRNQRLVQRGKLRNQVLPLTACE